LAFEGQQNGQAAGPANHKMAFDSPYLVGLQDMLDVCCKRIFIRTILMHLLTSPAPAIGQVSILELT
jgi:hypothetical protein